MPDIQNRTNADRLYNRESWDLFRDSGVLWLANRVLALFGWVLILVYEDDGTCSGIYPATLVEFNEEINSGEVVGSAMHRFIKTMSSRINARHCE